MQATSTTETGRGGSRSFPGESTVGVGRTTAHERTLRTALPSRYLKYRRYFEVVATLLLLALSLPLMGLIALAIRLESLGPALFHQQRVGVGGCPFIMLKFRSMHAIDDAGRAPITIRNDPRITRVGRLLRITHLDELPQLWNVLRGEMSLVGPRPEVAEMMEIYDTLIPDFWLRLQVPPGLTGLAQIRRGYADNLESTRRKLSDDLEYVRHISPLLDLLIILRTVVVVIRMRGR